MGSVVFHTHTTLPNASAICFCIDSFQLIPLCISGCVISPVGRISRGSPHVPVNRRLSFGRSSTAAPRVTASVSASHLVPGDPRSHLPPTSPARVVCRLPFPADTHFTSIGSCMRCRVRFCRRQPKVRGQMLSKEMEQYLGEVRSIV